MKEFAGILFTLKKRVQNIVENDLQYYKYTLFGFYDGLDINTVEKWYDLRPKGLQNRQLQVDMENPFMAQYTFRAEYYGAAEPPVRCGESHLSGLTEPPHFVY